jgi:hypothetical protein
MTGAMSISVAMAVGIVGIVCAVVAIALGAVVKPGPIVAESVGDEKVVAAV